MVMMTRMIMTMSVMTVGLKNTFLVPHAKFWVLVKGCSLSYYNL